MLRLSKLTDYATVILSLMAQDFLRIYTTAEISTATGVPIPTVSKILKKLVNATMVISLRGSKGGYRLRLEASQITVAAIIGVLEGPIALTECSVSQQGCVQASGCRIHANWKIVNQSIYSTLASITLADMIQPTIQDIPVPLVRFSSNSQH